ncbi:GNAT family N-acetyltransferase [Motilimonas pumila]|uniref:GNAT family N-acetyltransferase n=1 Tax=Motilimonas pumila TaxID=2303987 RepID=A0A418YB27_9GAMM|nr:GNAT family N-acetyltransferase [Motilimonas pumila]RJG40186.1 GNAT family N-acetyltransferase [Motilimonas pumila]
MHIEMISWQQALPIRQQVLWPNKSLSFCQVEGDELGLHFGAFKSVSAATTQAFEHSQLVAVASVYIAGDRARLRKFATLPEHQNQGIGTAMIHHILTELQRHQVKVFWCDARASAVGFYEQFSMTRHGAVFTKSGVEYYKMQRLL